jgi:hypothetical protein
MDQLIDSMEYGMDVGKFLMQRPIQPNGKEAEVAFCPRNSSFETDLTIIFDKEFISTADMLS